MCYAMRARTAVKADDGGGVDVVGLGHARPHQVKAMNGRVAVRRQQLRAALHGAQWTDWAGVDTSTLVSRAAFCACARAGARVLFAQGHRTGPKQTLVMCVSGSRSSDGAPYVMRAGP